jgi:hypothetical protein
MSECVGCGRVVNRTGTRGPVPLRCAECKKAHRAARRNRARARVAGSRAKRRGALAAAWVRLHRPDVWAEIVRQAAAGRPDDS